MFHRRGRGLDLAGANTRLLSFHITPWIPQRISQRRQPQMTVSNNRRKWLVLSSVLRTLHSSTEVARSDGMRSRQPRLSDFLILWMARESPSVTGPSVPFRGPVIPPCLRHPMWGSSQLIALPSHRRNSKPRARPSSICSADISDHSAMRGSSYVGEPGSSFHLSRILCKCTPGIPTLGRHVFLQLDGTTTLA